MRHFQRGLSFQRVVVWHSMKCHPIIALILRSMVTMHAQLGDPQHMKCHAPSQTNN